MDRQLPPELIAKIIHDIVDTPSLLSLCLTSKITHGEAAKYLYHHIDDLGSVDERPHLQLLETLVANPNLASLVQTYISNCVALSKDPEEELARHPPTSNRPDPYVDGRRRSWRIWGLLPRALAVMVNLKLFRFREAVDRPSAHWILANPSTFKFQLEELEWGCYEETGEDLVRFLETQKSLKTLCLRDAPSCPIPFSVCPDLISIKGESGAVTKLLPGRPNITEVYWNQSRYRDGNGAHVSGIRIIPAILPELKRIRLLSIKDHGSSREPKLTKLVQWMPVLVILEVFHLPRVSYSTFIFKDCYDVHHPYRRTF